MYSTLLEEAKKQKVANPEAIARLGASQSALETGYGKHTAGSQNYFGIKARPGEEGSGGKETQEFINGKMVTVKDKFRKYNNMNESAADYIKFLQENNFKRQTVFLICFFQVIHLIMLFLTLLILIHRKDLLITLVFCLNTN
jgi:flagellum-specific peptidoglycan hydrolase FlgJ